MFFYAVFAETMLEQMDTVIDSAAVPAVTYSVSKKTSFIRINALIYKKNLL
mgnify:FL=1